MSRGQRLAFLGIAVAIAVVAVILLAGSGGGDEPQRAATATPTAKPAQTPEPQPPLLQRGKVRELRFTEGDTIRFRVRSDGPEEVHVHGYDLKKDIEPGHTVGFSFEATITGIFEVELEHSGEQLAELRVDPR